MPTAPDLITRTRLALSQLPTVVEKTMFRSTGFMVRGKLRVAARGDRIMLRVDPAAHSTLVRRIGCTTVVMKGREYKDYVHVAADALKTEAALQLWIDLAVRHNANIADDGA